MLDAEKLRDRLGLVWAAAELRVLGSVTSTNDIAWAWAEAGCPEGTAVFAEEQIQGRGRFGRAWHSPRGRGLLMSVVLRPPGARVTPAHVTALSALAVVEAIEAETGLAARVQWPNDVTLGGRKAAGVLVECRGSGATPCVVGIGVNVNTQPAEFPDSVRATATSLAAEAGHEFPREAVAARVLGELHRLYRDAAEGRWERVAAAWRRRASLLGQLVVVQSLGREHAGRLVGLDPLSGIELELPDGARRVFRAEDATRVLPRAGGV